MLAMPSSDGMPTVSIRPEGSDFNVLTQLSVAEVDERTWAEHGVQLQLLWEQVAHFDRRLQWHIGDWWNRGEKWGHRVEIVSAPTWRGPSLKTCRNLGSIARKVDVSRRRDTLPYSHQAELITLPPAKADELLDEAEREMRETGKVPPVQKIRHIARLHRRSEREHALAIRQQKTSARLGTKLYGVVLADPPWRYTTWAGTPEDADPAGETMSTDDLCDLQIPAAHDAVLFLWRPGPMLADAMRVIQAWGFEFRSEIVWVRNRLITGYWVRGRHQTLMICTRGHPVAPAPGEQPESVIRARIPRHDNRQKPEVFYQMIEGMYPSISKIEMFARRYRRGWDAFQGQDPEYHPAIGSEERGNPVIPDPAAGFMGV